MSFLQKVSEQLNLRWAWEKVRKEATPGDIWFDEVELASFDLNLQQNLQSIADAFLRGRYQLAPLRPLPFPKSAGDDGHLRVRQTFQLSVRDQVAWTAVVNVLGPHVDSNMPTWSYGNRLYRSIWVEDEVDGTRRQRFGHYRHASGRTYLSFGQSWPVFRRHVYLTTRSMQKPRSVHASEWLPELDERTQEEKEFQESAPDKYRCPFVDPNYWSTRRPSQTPQEEIFWCSIDLEKFYPSMSLQAVRDNIVAELPSEWNSDAGQLLDSMLEFPLNTDDWSSDELAQVGLTKPQARFTNIPTGLYVAGFLANAGMLKVDVEIQRRLSDSAVAHFRFVDDHIILAYSMESLIDWIEKYEQLLNETQTGVRINPEKIEPPALSKLFESRRSAVVGQATAVEPKIQIAAEKACRLDPQFPSPLMTKTLAMVSGIARTDFNLLETGELASLTEQLEHLLLVDISDNEMPAKTRLSFAATRLTRIVECRLANDELRATLMRRQEQQQNELKHLNSSDSRFESVKEELHVCEKELDRQESILNVEARRAFQLLRKVLRERPDRVRLWTRAIIMCRLTGVNGLVELIDDIRREGEGNPLVAEYLTANLLGLIGSQSLIAANVIVSDDSPAWRKKASQQFLEHVSKLSFSEADFRNIRWFVRDSWLLYCFGLHCTAAVLRKCALPIQVASLKFSAPLLGIGKACVSKGDYRHEPEQWAWWAARTTLRQLEARANGLVKELGDSLEPCDGTAAYWRSFPLDVPSNVLRYLIRSSQSEENDLPQEGWWYDALRGNAEIRNELSPRRATGSVRRVRLALKSSSAATLYEWSDFLSALPQGGSTDPRAGEWTALEIVRQIGSLLSVEPVLSAAYIQQSKAKDDSYPSLHPANFRLPRSWLNSEINPSWSDWRSLARPAQRKRAVTLCPKPHRIRDGRYTPLIRHSQLFATINPVRGLGLLLYGLLKRSFDLPAIWNGPGHADVLGMLPMILLADVTCSSMTLGLLQGCLQSRSVENLIIRHASKVDWPVDDDMSEDPYHFVGIQEVILAVEACQRVLESCQLSTLNHRARQLTPVSINQLTKPNWSKVFSENAGTDGGFCE